MARREAAPTFGEKPGFRVPAAEGKRRFRCNIQMEVLKPQLLVSRRRRLIGNLNRHSRIFFFYTWQSQTGCELVAHLAQSDGEDLQRGGAIRVDGCQPALKFNKRIFSQDLTLPKRQDLYIAPQGQSPPKNISMAAGHGSWGRKSCVTLEKCLQLADSSTQLRDQIKPAVY